MLNELINKVFPQYSKERRCEICEFLKEQEIKENDKFNTFSSSLFIISKLYDDIPNLQLMFNKNMETISRKTQFLFTREQIQDINVITGINVFEQMLNTIMSEMIDNIKKEIKDIINVKNYITTDRDFLSIFIYDTETSSSKLCVSSNWKVLSVRDLRKLKLNEINDF